MYDKSNTASEWQYKSQFIKNCIGKIVNCAICAYKGNFDEIQGWEMNRRFFEIDHIIPYRVSHKNIGNLQILCRACHKKKCGEERRELYKKRGGMYKDGRKNRK